jgi:hypothetical protein
MKIRSGNLCISLIVLLVLLITLIPACTDSPSEPITVKLSFSEPPALNKEVKVTATFSLTSKYYEPEAQNVEAQILLPIGFERIDGDLTWKGNLARGASQSLNATIAAIKTGDWQIKAIAEHTLNEHGRERGEATLYISVSENSVSVSDKSPGGNLSFALPGPSQTPNPHASPIYTLPSPKPIEPGQVPTVSGPPY